MKPLRILTYLLLFTLILIILLFLIRLTLPRELDDVSPSIKCSEKLIEKSDVLWIIPKFNNKSILEKPGWCEKISNYNKELGLHGVYHTYQEFLTDKNQEYLQEGIDIFKECFGFKPTRFKPPQLEINNKNKELISEKNMNLKLKYNQLFHKVYHCKDTGVFKNSWIDVF